jgi:SAM-dependent methyltransferase
MTAGERLSEAIRFYDRSAAAIAPRYDAVAFADVHPGLGPHLPPAPSFILDVGAGSGRDAAAFVQLGHRVMAVEPSAAFRALGEAAVPGAEWLDDQLPDLASLRGCGKRFDFILCSAVLMSVAAHELAPSLASMAALLGPGGRLAVSLRDPAHEENLLTRHDDSSVRAAARSAGLQLSSMREDPDALGRAHRWRSYVFEQSNTVQPGGSGDDRNRS